MGFGTFFIGYFFLVNISYFEYTDIAAAMIMLLGLYSLSRFNRGFKSGLVFASLFAVFSMGEFIFAAIRIFDPSFLAELSIAIFSIPRYALIFGITISTLMGICEIAREVELFELSKSSGRIIPFCAVYVIMAICEIPQFSQLLGVAMSYIYFAVLLGHLLIVAATLITVYKAYARICMPEDLERTPKESRFEFVNKLREREEQKNLEYADYKIKKGLEQKRKSASKKKK